MANRINPKYRGHMSDALSPKVLYKMADLLSVDLQWRQLAAAISDPRFVFSDTEIEEIASKSLSLVEKPALAFLRKLGVRDMTVYELCAALNSPQFERISLLIRDDTPLRLIQDIPRTATVPTGGILELECKADGFPFPRYMWFKGNSEILGQDKPILHIMMKDVGDSGDYICRMHNYWMRPDDTIFSSICSVTVPPGSAYISGPASPPTEGYLPHAHPQPVISTTGVVPLPPNIIKQTELERFQIIVNSPISLECYAVSNQPLYYAWYKDSRPLPGFSGPVLHIVNAQPIHTGTYYCVITSGYGCNVQGRKVEVVVHLGCVPAEPAIQKHPLDILVSEGGCALFEVEAIGVEPLKYQWFRNGRVIQGAVRKRYEVANCDSEKHGEYMCKVFNDITPDGVFSKGARLTTKPGNPEVPIYFAGDKTALLIGIGDIVGGRRLHAPHNDLTIMQKCLEALNFKVYSYYNLQQKQMLEMVRLYASRLGEQTYSVFYFSGHGFECSRCLYMVPSDAPNGFRPVDCVRLEDVKFYFQEKNPMLNVIITDMCRDNRPWPLAHDSQREQRVTAPICSVQSGNTIELCATSSGRQAFEPEQGTGGLEPGGLVSKLRQYIPGKRPVSEIFNKVKEEMHRDSDYRRQLPEIRSDNLSRALSLADQIQSGIHDADYRETLQRSQDLYNEMHKMTFSGHIVCGSDHRQLFHIDCLKIFSNVILLRVTPIDMPIAKVELRGGHPEVTCTPLKKPGHPSSNTTTAAIPFPRSPFEFMLSHLEQLNRHRNIPPRNLKYELVISMQTNERFHYGIDLGYPLAATPFLGEELYPWQQDMQEHYGRQPEENYDPEARRESVSSDISGC